jgi:hypothetical protein
MLGYQNHHPETSSSASARYSSISDFMGSDIFLTCMKSFKPDVKLKYNTLGLNPDLKPISQQYTNLSHINKYQSQPITKYTNN